MDFTIRRKNLKQSPTSDCLVETYPHDLQMYTAPPVQNLSLHEFEAFALERVTLLRTLATATTLKGLRPYSEEWTEYVISELRANGLKYYVKLCEKTSCGTSDADLQARRKDHFSHFILRLAYCRTDELRRWFIAREMELFRMRFMNMRGGDVDTFFKLNNLHYTNITDEEKQEIITNLRESTGHPNIENMKFYKVGFTKVLDLVRARKVYLSGGYAYISHKDFISVLSAKFRTHLKKCLAISCHHLGEIEQDERLANLLKGLHQSYSGNDYSDSKSAVPIESLDSLSVKSFPLCMRQLHEQLRSAHHLKHGGRLQYGLFLKGIGVTLEDSIKFWREEFTKMMDLDKFEKSYAYNVRYNYGKEGSKKNYPPFSCLKIIQNSIGPGDCHGCPFRHGTVTNLKNKLHGYGIDSQVIQDIVDLAKNGHYQISCSRYFDAVHNSNIGVGINHPNQYFEESQKIIKGDVKVEHKSEMKRRVKKEDNHDLDGLDFDEPLD